MTPSTARPIGLEGRLDTLLAELRGERPPRAVIGATLGFIAHDR
ncbi:MAG: hypothetical protein U1F43_17935 [Myxococcota bacterium]